MEKILLVEDKTELRNMLAEALARMGYSATPVGSAEAAIATVAAVSAESPARAGLFRGL